MSEQFNIGDDVIVVNDATSWLDSEDELHTRILKIVDSNKHGYLSNLRANQITIDNVVEYPEDFQVVSKPKEYATAGLTSVGNTYGLVGEQCSDYVIPITRIEKEETVSADGGPVIGKLNIPSGLSDETCKQFGEMLVKAHESKDSQILGIYRPQLETRKFGKVRVELVDDGFPLAIREISKLMTWAQEAKGYRDHDWQNLPNWEIALAAATSRHRTDFIKQRVVEGLDIDECVDPESGLLHKVHEAFGVLAQLELMLRNKSK